MYKYSLLSCKGKCKWLSDAVSVFQYSDEVLNAFSSCKLDDLMSQRKTLTRRDDQATNFFAKYLTSEKVLQGFTLGWTVFSLVFGICSLCSHMDAHAFCLFLFVCTCNSVFVWFSPVKCSGLQTDLVIFPWWCRELLWCGICIGMFLRGSYWRISKMVNIQSCLNVKK